MRGLLPALLLLGLTGSLLAESASERSAREARRERLEALGGLGPFDERAWSAAYTQRSRHYDVRTNTSRDVARYVGTLMDHMAHTYREVFTYRTGPIPRLPVDVYATRADFVEHCGIPNLPPNIAGLYFPRGRGAIHMPWTKFSGQHPAPVLYHEGLHQFVHHCLDYPLPPFLRDRVEEEHHRLPAIPVWLNEGMATYMESAWFDGDRVRLGRINRGRLLQLQQMMRGGRTPALKPLIGKRYGTPLTSAEYAMFYGLVLSLRHDADLAAENAGRQRLGTYIRECRRGFFRNQVDFKDTFMEGDNLKAGFLGHWHQHISDAGTEAFERHIIGRGSDWEAWEKDWREKILSVDANKPYGGLGKGDGVERHGRSFY